jgi:hypothetical protein
VLQSCATSSASVPCGLHEGGLLSWISCGLAPILLGGSRVGSRSHRHGKREAQRAVRRWIYDDGMIEGWGWRKRKRLALARKFDIPGLALARAGSGCQVGKLTSVGSSRPRTAPKRLCSPPTSTSSSCITLKTPQRQRNVLLRHIDCAPCRGSYQGTVKLWDRQNVRAVQRCIYPDS